MTFLIGWSTGVLTVLASIAALNCWFDGEDL